jgi:hypothetical protein
LEKLAIDAKDADIGTEAERLEVYEAIKRGVKEYRFARAF